MEPYSALQRNYGRQRCRYSEKYSPRLACRKICNYPRCQTKDRGSQMKEKYTLFSLFSGAGGLDLGFILTKKFNVIFANDVFAPATETYSTNFKINLAESTPSLEDLPAVFRGDISNLQFEEYQQLYPDVVTGGPPCQDFSIVRGPEAERMGITVSRGRLYSHFVRALIHLQPKLFIFENVPGLISANKGKAYEVILEDFSNLDIRWNEIRKLVGNKSKITPKKYAILFSRLVDASKIGVPQARRRVIIIGMRKDLVSNDWWQLAKLKQKVERKIKGENKYMRKYPLTPLEVFEGRPLPDLQSKYEEIMKDYGRVAEEVGTPTALEWKNKVWSKITFNVMEDYLMLNNITPKDEDEAARAFEEHEKILKELGYLGVSVSNLKGQKSNNEIPKEASRVIERMKRIPPGENHQFVRGTPWEVEGRGISLIYRRLHPLKPSYTIVAYGGGGTWGYHYERSRSMLTNRERARLQTFPDSFSFKGTFSEIRAQIGEAVPPLLGKRIAEAMIEILEEL